MRESRPRNFISEAPADSSHRHFQDGWAEKYQQQGTELISSVIWKESTPLGSPPVQFSEGLGVLSDEWMDRDVSVILKKEIVRKWVPLRTLITNTRVHKISDPRKLEILRMGIPMPVLIKTIVYTVRDCKKKHIEN